MIERRPPQLLRLKLLLRDVHPAVWRRVELADSLSIADLHRVIQLLMGWDDDHLHRFRIHGRDYGIAYVGGPSFDEDAAVVWLAQFGFRPTERFLYEYDYLASNLAVAQGYGRAAAGANAASHHQAHLSIGSGLPLLDAQMLFGCRNQLVRALDVTRRAGADRDGMFAGRFEREVVVERRHTIRLAQRHVERKRDKANGVVVKISKRRLHGVQSFDQCVACKAVLAHGTVDDFPSLVVTRQWWGRDSGHIPSVIGTTKACIRGGRRELSCLRLILPLLYDRGPPSLGDRSHRRVWLSHLLASISDVPH